MKVSYYPGCSLKGSARDYEASIQAVCKLLDIELCELEDWNCCGSTAAHSLNHKAGINLPARNLAIAEKAGMDVLVPCPLCYNRLKTAEKELTGTAGSQYDVYLSGEQVNVWDLANYLAREMIMNRIVSNIKQELKGLKAVCYYGCMSSRPPKVTGEPDYENPMSMDRILQRLNVEVMQWSYKTDCCGASHLVARPDIVFELVGKLFQEADRAGANCIVVSCQMCQANLDMNQEKIMKHIGTEYHFPVFYFTELIGMALSHKDVKKWLKKHFTDPLSLVENIVQFKF